MFTDATVDDDNFDDCADEGVVLDGPASLLRQLIDAEPSPPAFTSALWRGVVDVGALNHRAESLTSLPPEPG